MKYRLKVVLFVAAVNFVASCGASNVTADDELLPVVAEELVAIPSMTAAPVSATSVPEMLSHPLMVSNENLSSDPGEQAVQIATMLRVVFEPLEPSFPGVVDRIIDVGDCESGLNQLEPDGRLRVNPDPKSSAGGALQVLLNTHKPDYLRVGLNPREAPDNLIFGRFLVERKLRQGRRNPLEDWVCA